MDSSVVAIASPFRSVVADMVKELDIGQPYQGFVSKHLLRNCIAE
tara:strand:- start:87 stop:221 length:135 start_codon:yes stop_codon:yes gene_type:complete